jgi:uncharacterized Zn finger protein (UPF0148 family)
MEMPTPCVKCGEVFELLDGLTSEKWFPERNGRGTIICEPCGREEREEIERDEEISELKEQIDEAEYVVRSARDRLVELGERVALPLHLSEVFRIVEGATRGDSEKVKAYAGLLADKLEEDGEANSAKWLRQIIEGNAGARIVAHEQAPGSTT